MNRATGLGSINRACDNWIRQASPAERVTYIRTGAYTGAGLTDTRSQAHRLADVRRVVSSR